MFKLYTERKIEAIKEKTKGMNLSVIKQTHSLVFAEDVVNIMKAANCEKYLIEVPENLTRVKNEKLRK